MTVHSAKLSKKDLAWVNKACADISAIFTGHSGALVSVVLFRLTSMLMLSFEPKDRQEVIEEWAETLAKMLPVMEEVLSDPGLRDH